MNTAIDTIGWTLLHFVWQGAAIAATAAVLLRVLRARSASTRYAVACAALVLCLAAPALTARVLWSSPVTHRTAAATTVRIHITRTSPPLWTEPPAAAALPPAHSQNGNAMLRFAVGIWLAGVVLLALRLGGGWWRLRTLHRRVRALAPSRWQAAAALVSARLDVTRLIAVVDSDLVDTPTLIGWLTPVIVLPIAAMASLNPAQVEAILAHELAHVRRHDYLVNLLQAIAETLLFYHPGVWWLSRRIRSEREHCCDDLAVGACGDRIGYAAALAELETWRSTRPSLALAATSGPLLERVRRLLAPPPVASRAPSTYAGMLAAPLIALVALGSASQFVVMARSAEINTPRRVAQWEPLRVEWRRAMTEHFELSLPAGQADRTAALTQLAETAYQKISSDLQHDLLARTPLMLFDSRAALDRLLAAGALPDAGPGQRILLPLDGNEGVLESALLHELTHVFEADILGSLDAPPMWVTEGLAEHEHGEWSAQDRVRLIALLRTGRFPTLGDLSSQTPASPMVAYTVGHAAFDFIHAHWGTPGVRRLLEVVRTGIDDPVVFPAPIFDMAPAAFHQAFEEYVRTTLAPPAAPPPPLAAASLPDEVIRRNRSTDARSQFDFSADRIAITGATLRELIRFAYGVQEADLTGGPAWMDTTRFDIVTGGDGDGAHQGSPALRAVLDRHFRLEMHRGQRRMPAFVLTTMAPGSIGPRLRASALDCAARERAQPPAPTFTVSVLGVLADGPGCGMTWLEHGRASGRGISMTGLAGMLAASPRVNRPVLDRTGLPGLFDLDLDFSPAVRPANAPLNAVGRALEWAGVRTSLSDALRDQLGLALESGQSQVSAFRVDRAEPPAER